MGTFTAQSILDKAALVLYDTGNTRWSAAELLGWLNDGQREIVALRPDTDPQTAVVQLAVGTKQSLPADGYTLLTVVRNMGTNGTTVGAAIREVQRKQLDADSPGWHAENGYNTTDHFIFDPRTPKTFYVYPPSLGANYVELVYASVPADITDVDEITLDDVYANPLLDYVLYRAYSRDFEQTGAGARAMAHRQAFENSLGLKAQADAATTTNLAAKG